MDGAEFKRLQALTGLTNQALANRMAASLPSIQRWRRDGCAGTPAVMVQLLASLARTELQPIGMEAWK